jgi:hypothetical protein
VFDLAPDGTPKGVSYIKALEDKNALLESRLKSYRNGALLQDRAAGQEVESCEQLSPSLNVILNHQSDLAVAANTELQADAVKDSVAPSSVAFEDLTLFTLATHGSAAATVKFGPLPSLPPPDIADKLLQSCYQHTQAYICIVDWVMLRRWHERRETVCFATAQDGPEAMKQAYFLWMSYAIGAQLDACSDVPCGAYYARALQYFSAPLIRDDLVAVQALLMLAQYSFRALVWDVTSPRHDSY